MEPRDAWALAGASAAICGGLLWVSKALELGPFCRVFRQADGVRFISPGKELVFGSAEVVRFYAQEEYETELRLHTALSKRSVSLEGTRRWPYSMGLTWIRESPGHEWIAVMGGHFGTAESIYVYDTSGNLRLRTNGSDSWFEPNGDLVCVDHSGIKSFKSPFEDTGGEASAPVKREGQEIWRFEYEYWRRGGIPSIEVSVDGSWLKCGELYYRVASDIRKGDSRYTNRTQDFESLGSSGIADVAIVPASFQLDGEAVTDQVTISPDLEPRLTVRRPGISLVCIFKVYPDGRERKFFEQQCRDWCSLNLDLAKQASYRVEVLSGTGSRRISTLWLRSE